MSAYNMFEFLNLYQCMINNKICKYFYFTKWSSELSKPGGNSDLNLLLWEELIFYVNNLII